jgi:hypothetical protein
MPRIKLVMLSLLAASALCAVASAAASAHEFKVEGNPIGAGEKEESQAESGITLLEVAGKKVLIWCQEDTGYDINKSLSIEEKGKSKFELEMRSCILWENKEGRKVQPPECKIVEKRPLAAVVIKGTDELIGLGEDEFKVASGTLVLEGAKCPLEHESEITGSTVCALPEGALELVLHRIVCTAATSKLKVGTEPAALFSNEAFRLQTLKKWSAV